MPRRTHHSRRTRRRHAAETYDGPVTYDDMARSLVRRGLASPLILLPARRIDPRNTDPKEGA